MTTTKAMLVLVTMLLPVMLICVEYNVNNYQVPDYFSHGLCIEADNNGYFRNLYDDEYSYHTGSFEAEYTVDKYSRKNILNLNFKPRIGYNLDYYNTTDTLKVNSDTPALNFSFKIDAELRRYIFAELFCDIKGNFHSNNYFSDSETESKEYHSEGDSDEYSCTAACEIGLGYGRVEDVRKACKANEILLELEKAKLLVRKTNTQDVETLADLLVSMTTLRLFDNRLLNMEKVRRINNSLVEMGLLAGDDIDSFVIIMDLFYIDSVFSRKTGWEVSTAMGLENDESNYNIETETDYCDTLTSDFTSNYQRKGCSNTYQPGIHFSFYHVLSSKWQLAASASYSYLWYDYDYSRNRLSVYETKTDTLDENHEIEMEGYSLKFDLELSWYPDTRTKLWTSVEYLISDMDIDESYYQYYTLSDYFNDAYDKKFTESQLDYRYSAGLYYYFSPRLSLDFMATYYFNDGQNIENSESLINDWHSYSSSFDYSLTLKYYLF